MSQFSDNSLSDLLGRCGFRGHEATVLAELLEAGAQTAGLLARRTRLKRPTVYLALDSLIEQGLVIRQKAAKVLRFQSLPPQVLVQALRTRAEGQFEQLRVTHAALDRAVEQIKPEVSRRFGDFIVETIDTQSGVYGVLYSSLMGGDFCGVFDPQVVVTAQSKKVLVEFAKRTAKTKPKIREIAVDGPACRWYLGLLQNPNHQVKLVDRRHSFPSDTILVEDSVILISYEHKSESAIRIQHADYHRSMMSMFDMLWEKLSN